MGVNWLNAGMAAAMAIGAAYTLPGTHAAAGRPVTLFAAASLKEALDGVLLAQRKAGGGEITVSYAGSNALARQIEQGAPADIFISADEDWMDYLAARKLLRGGSVVPLLENALVMIAPREIPEPEQIIRPDRIILAQRLHSGRLALADTSSVPAGRYARAALEYLGLWNDFSSQLAQTGNVRAALLFVARGEAPLGIVYATDAMSEPRVTTVYRFPAGSHPLIIYPAAIVQGSKHPQAAAVLDYLKSQQAQAIFKTHGFIIPGKPGT